MISKILYHQICLAALLTALLLCGSVAQGQARCAWLNVATASGVLGGPAALEIQTPSTNETRCVFRRDDFALSLEIVVKSQQDASRGITLEQPTCTGPGTAVPAIGNEALVCADDHKSTRGAEVIGRVRDRVFRVAIVTSARNDPALTRDILEQKARDTAEQVAGALF